MAMTPLPAGVGGTLFAAGGGQGGGAAASPFASPGGVKGPAGGKNSTQQNLHSPHSGFRSTITSGDPMSRAMGQYGKGHSLFGADLPGGTLGGSLKSIRGGTGQMRRIRGGLGPGKTGTAGGSSDYSMQSPDSE
jgi:hypothetical protein